ncbi:hypothetical protein HGRIS_006909 [Hohenbuehelia grisea]|uniref:Defective in cullin neddylation protein n=1 Tax=Hohenbuehelia grisea TaxID=104357 RepID=A0ABR3JAE6_9AGAR
MEDQVAQFCGVTGASVKDARRFIERHKRLDYAIDAYYNDPNAFSAVSTPRRQEPAAPSTSKLNSLFDTYKDPDSEYITVDGTIKLCEDLSVDPEDVVLLAVAYELKSTKMAEWNKKGWVDGWKSLGCDTISAMRVTIMGLRDKLGNDAAYFQKVYNHTFDFARSEGQRSLAIDTAQAFWSLLLPHGLQGGALSHIRSRDNDNDETMVDEEGWKTEYTQWWFEFLAEKGGKGVSKDTWVMFLEFVRTIDSKFEMYDMEAAWPSTIDDFVEWSKARL